ncbi:MAG TPA: SDR family oxidoreductase [Streptosporangiaceae bacterium]|jgi:NAD(P)-dependent dehydrogenase (short-subunit alcohol dehydrogenase family)|nr:SDR family oxidoreductase [Streptosporangiaceae bacterium]
MKGTTGLAVRMPLAGQCAVVTGGGGGIGSAAARALAAAGLFVHVADYRHEQAAAVAAQIEAAGGAAMPHPVDVSSADAVAELFRQVDSAGHSPDLLVNSAGVITYGAIGDLPLADLTQMVDVNLTGTFLCLREAATRMGRTSGGRIINIASTASFVAPRLLAAAYSMTKGGVRQLTVAAAAELAASGILVNAVAPGTTRTEFVQGSLASEEKEAEAAAKIPLGRVAEPEDVVGAILFFASRFADYITGQTLLVDGGRTTRSA